MFSLRDKRNMSQNYPINISSGTFDYTNDSSFGSNLFLKKKLTYVVEVRAKALENRKDHDQTSSEKNLTSNCLS